ncbi:MAG: response regulator [Candidatus Acidiferrales bacterium]
MRKNTPRRDRTTKPADVRADRPGLNFRPQLNFPITIFRSLLESLEIGVAHASVDGDILWANPRFAEIFGRPTHKLTGSKLKTLVHVAGWDSLATALKQGEREFAKGTMTVFAEDLSPGRSIELVFTPIMAGARPTVEIVATEVTELANATKALKQSEASLQSLSARLLQIQDEERRRLARDLHDTTGQELSVVIMALDHLAKQLAGSPGERQKSASDCVNRLRKVENDLRTLSYVLHPPLLDEMGLASALGWYLDGYQKRTGIKVERDIPPGVPRFSAEKETALFRVIQECLTNVYRHSGSRCVHVRLSVGPRGIETTVQDQGKGFESDALSKEPNSGVGIQSMKGRLEMVGGSFEISSNRAGTRVVATVPLEVNEVLTSEDQEKDEEDRRRQDDQVVRRRILIADDHMIARRGIRTLFDNQPDLEICGEASDGLEALEQTKVLKPDLVILDLSMPKMGGLTVATQIRKAGIETKVLVYTSHSYSQLETTAMAAGCDGYVVKSDATHDLVRATRTVLNGGRFYRTEMPSARSA